MNPENNNTFKYTLVKDITKDSPVVVNKPTKINVVKYNKETGKKVNIEFPVPHLPNKKCNKCYGRGYLGIDTKSNSIILCHKCYKPKM